MAGFLYFFCSSGQARLVSHLQTMASKKQKKINYPKLNCPHCSKKLSIGYYCEHVTYCLVNNHRRKKLICPVCRKELNSRNGFRGHCASKKCSPPVRSEPVDRNPPQISFRSDRPSIETVEFSQPVNVLYFTSEPVFTNVELYPVYPLTFPTNTSVSLDNIVPSIDSSFLLDSSLNSSLLDPSIDLLFPSTSDNRPLSPQALDSLLDSLLEVNSPASPDKA